MKLVRNSIAYKIVIPIVMLITCITLFLFVLVQTVSTKIAEDYQNFTVTHYAGQISRILDRAVVELTAARLLGNPMVTEAKKRSVLEALTIYWSNNKLDGIVLDSGNALFSSLDPALLDEVLHNKAPGQFHFAAKGVHHHGYSAEFSPWGWTVITITKPATPLLTRKNITFFLPLIGLGALLMAGGVFLILQWNFRRPLKALIQDIAAGREAGRTNVAELDTIGSAINDSLGKLRKQTEQYQLLHNLAVSLHEITSGDDMLKIILERAGRLIKAELAAIALYDEKGGFKKLVSLNTPPGLENLMPEGKGILKAVRLSLVPLRINEVRTHPAFSGSFPDVHPPVHNLLGYPIFSDDGRPMGALYFGNKPGGFTDDDESVLRAISADAAIALNKAERMTQLTRFKEVIDSAFDVVIISDSEGRIQYVNPAFESVTGYSRDEVIGKAPDFLTGKNHDESFHQSMENARASGLAWKGEFASGKKDGSRYFSSAIIFPVRTDEGVNFVSIQRDITQERRLYEQLLRAQKMEAIGTLAGGIAHEFNNLLAGILGYAEIISKQTREGDPFHKPAAIIHQAAKRGSDLAKKILIITRKEKLEARPVDLNEIVQDTVDLLQKSMPKDIEIVMKSSAGLPLVKADPTQLQQVVMNLSMNARDAMPDGGRLVIETGVVGAENDAAQKAEAGASGHVKLTVSDTGTGMDVELQRKIFDPFFTTKETGKGTGLGLFIVHSVVNNHGGYINLYSEPGKGTRFNVYLPFTAGLAPEEHALPADLSGSGTILVVDDEEHVRELCKDILQPLGYQVLIAENGEEGTRLFRERKDEIALVMLDMVMPKMGGGEVFRTLLLIKPEVKVLLFSGYSQNGFAGIDALLRNGAHGFIQKPFSHDLLAGTIKNILLK